jgi:hypothetical protein
MNLVHASRVARRNSLAAMLRDNIIQHVCVEGLIT